MDSATVLIKYAPSSIDVSGSVIKRLDIWKRMRDGTGQFSIRLKNDNNEWVGQFSADDPVQIAINSVIFLKGYLDKGFPKSEAETEVLHQLYELTGRDYGQDLMNKQVNKGGDWMYKSQPADDIVDDMLTQAGSEITFTSPGSAPSISYTDIGDEQLLESFRKIAEEIDYALYVKSDKSLYFGTGETAGFSLTSQGLSSDNILELKKTEFDAYEIRNYLIIKGRDVEDSWTDPNDTDWVAGSGCSTLPEYTIVKKGVGSIKLSKGGDYENLNVDARIGSGSSWAPTGTTPYIDAKDYPTNYIATGSANDLSREFTFQNPTYEPISCVLKINVWQTIGETPKVGSVEVHDGVSWSSPYSLTFPYSDGDYAEYQSIDVSSFLNTQTKINNAKIRITSSGSFGIHTVDHAYLQMEYGVFEVNMSITFPKFNYDYLPFDKRGKGDLTIWANGHTGDDNVYPTIRINLQDDAGNRISYSYHAESNRKQDLWYQYTFPVGTDCEIMKYRSWKTRNQVWEYANSESTDFNWKVVKIEIYANSVCDYVYIDGISMPVQTLAIKQDAGSQSSYKVRRTTISGRHVRTQAELEEYGDSELEKLKGPYEGLKIIAKGSAGIVGGIDHWYPGGIVTVTSTPDGINASYIMKDIHLVLSETPLYQGHTFIAEVNLIPVTAKLSGRRGELVDSHETGMLRELHDRVRFMERVEESERDWMPVLPKPIVPWQVKVGDFATLAETLVPWQVKYEAESADTIPAQFGLIADATASDGEAVKCEQADASGSILFDTTNKCPTGDLYALFRMKVTSRTSGSDIVKIGVWKSGVGWRASELIKPNMFPTANSYHHFAVRVNMQENDDNLWTPVLEYYTGITDLTIDFCGFVPANLPLGYSDVTVLTEDPGSTGSLVDPGTTGENVDPGTTGDNVDPGTATSITDLDSEQILALGLGSEINLTAGPSWTTVRSGTCGSLGSGTADNIAIILVEAIQNQAGQSARIQWVITIGGVDYFTFFGRLSNQMGYLHKIITYSGNLEGVAVALKGRCEGGESIKVKGELHVNQRKQHSHPVTGDAHTTPISGDAHTTPITGDSHTTPITGDAHAHDTTPSGHEH